MTKDNKLAAAAGDARCTAMLRRLGEDGWRIVEPYEDSAAIVLPMPYTRDGVTVAKTGIPLSRLFERTGSSRPILGGRLDRAAYRLAMEYGVRLFDYFSPEWVQIENAALTAIGALGLPQVKQAPTGGTLVCGFGRIGKCLAARIPDVTVSARSDEDLSWIRSLGYRCVRTEDIDASEYTLIFNTIPSPHLGAHQISAMKKESVIIDLASPPFGTDFAAAEAAGITAITAPSLPAKAYPEHAGDILARSIMEILRNVGVEK